MTCKKPIKNGEVGDYSFIHPYIPLYASIALKLSPHTFPYCLTNLGRNRPGGKFPDMSTWTSTWPEQPLPAPMPMVGMPRRLVIRLATSAGMASSTKAKQPAAWRESASSRTWRAPRVVLPWTRNPPRAFCRWGVRPMWPITGMPARVIRLMVGAISLPPSSLTLCTRPSLMIRMADSRACSGAIS